MSKVPRIPPTPPAEIATTPPEVTPPVVEVGVTRPVRALKVCFDPMHTLRQAGEVFPYPVALELPEYLVPVDAPVERVAERPADPPPLSREVI